MRKLLAVALLAAIAAPASAAQLGLRFVGGIDDTNAEVAQGGTIQVEVTWTFNDATDATNGLNAVAFNLTSAPENASPGLQGELVADNDLFMSNNATGLVNWNAANVPGAVGGLSQFSAFGNTGADSVFGVGTFVVGTFDISVDGGALLGSVHPFFIQRDGIVSPDAGQGNGAPYAFNNSGDGYNGQFSIGAGYAGNLNGSNNSPLTITVTPEPAALALLALGGIAVLRRRS